MRYKGIFEITLKPGIPDVNSRAILGSLKGAGHDVLDVRTGKVIEVEFECEPEEAADYLDRMGKELLAHPVTEQYAYRLQMIGDQGFGETTVRYSEPQEAVLAETPMRYAVDEGDVVTHDLRGKVPKIGRFELLQAEWVATHPIFALIKYAEDGVEQTAGIRMDLDKRCFLDDLPDESDDQILKGMAHSIWDEICLGIKAHQNIDHPPA